MPLECGALCVVTTGGADLMLKLCAINWDLITQVRECPILPLYVKPVNITCALLKQCIN